MVSVSVEKITVIDKHSLSVSVERNAKRNAMNKTETLTKPRMQLPVCAHSPFSQDLLEAFLLDLTTRPT